MSDSDKEDFVEALRSLEERVENLEALTNTLFEALKALQGEAPQLPEPKLGRGKHAHLTHRECVEKAPDYVIWMHDQANTGTFQAYGFYEEHYTRAKQRVAELLEEVDKKEAAENASYRKPAAAALDRKLQDIGNKHGMMHPGHSDGWDDNDYDDIPF